MPKPLLHKLIAQAEVGFFFLLVGCVYGIHSKDYIFIMLSLLIGLCSLIHTCNFYQSVIFCGQFNTYHPFLLPAPAFALV